MEEVCDDVEDEAKEEEEEEEDPVEVWSKESYGWEPASRALDVEVEQSWGG